MPIQRHQLDSFASQKFADDTRGLAAQVDSNPIFNGAMLEDIVVTTSGTEIPHLLGRYWRGFLVIKKTGAAIIYNEPSEDETKFIRLRSSSGTQTISLWVF